MAETLGTERVAYRPRFQRAPDAVPFQLRSGEWVCPESKSRKRIPSLVRLGIEQAEGYRLGTPLLVIAGLGGEQIACVRLADLARWLELVIPVPKQRPTRRATKQLELVPIGGAA
jgi:hypothetical protein